MSYGIAIHVPEAPITEEWTWETDLAVSYNGTEDRTPLLRYPRRVFSGQFVFTEVEDLRRYIAMATKRFRTEFAFPLFQYGAKLKSRVLFGSDTVFVNARRSNLRAGKAAILIEGDKFEQVEVLAVTATSVQFALPLANSYSPRAILCPLATVYSNTNASVTRLNPDRAGSASFTFIERLPTVPFVSPLNEASVLIFDNLPVLPFVPKGASFESSVATGLQVSEYLAVDDLVSPWTFEQWAHSVTFGFSQLIPKFAIDLTKSFPVLYKDSSPGYPEPGEFYPASVRLGPFDTNVRIVAGNADGTGFARPDDFLYFNGVQFGAVAGTEFPAGTVFYELTAGDKLQVQVLNTLEPQAGISGALTVQAVPNFEWWEKFADLVQGSANPFLFPTNRSDLEVVTPAAPGGTRVTVSGDEYTQHYWGHGGFSRIFIDSDAGRHFAKVTAISSVAGNDRLTFQPALPEGAEWASNQRVGFLLKVRLDNDKIVLNHAGLSTEVSIALRTVV